MRAPARLSRFRDPLRWLCALGLLLSACQGRSQAAVSSNEAALVPLRLGGPWSAAAGKTPKAIGPLGYALELGKAQPILARHGYRFERFVSFNNGPPIVQALQAGSIELGTLGDTPAVSGRAGGVDTRAVLIDKPTGDAWFLAKKGGVTRVAELRGKRVGVQFGSNFDKYGRGVLAAAGILPEVQLLNIPIAEGLGALTRGDIDGYALPANTAATWVDQQGFPVLDRASRTHPELQGTLVTLVTSKFLREHPNIQAALWEATAAGIQEIARDRAAYLRFLADTSGHSLAVLEQTQLLEFGAQPIDPAGKASVGSTLQFLLQFGTAKAAFSVDEWVVPGAGVGGVTKEPS